MRYQVFSPKERQFMKGFFTGAAILGLAVFLSACTSDFQRQGYAAVKSDCRLRGFIPGTQEYQDCIKVGNHNIDVVDMQHRLLLMQQFNAVGARYTPQPAPAPQPLPEATVGNPQVFCYPTDNGYTYCQ